MALVVDRNSSCIAVELTEATTKCPPRGQVAAGAGEYLHPSVTIVGHVDVVPFIHRNAAERVLDSMKLAFALTLAAPLEEEGATSVELLDATVKSSPA